MTGFYGMMLLKKLRSALLLCCCTGIVLTGCSRSGTTVGDASPEQKDSISLWIQQAKDTSGAVKMAFLEKACRNTHQLPDDSLKLKHLTALSYEYLGSTDSTTFRKVNREAMQLAVKIKDSSALGDTCWDLGDYFSEKLYKIDSAFYYYTKAQRLYQRLGNDFYSARMLLNMAIEQIGIKDYVSSEITTVKAIKLLQPLKKYTQLYKCYNNLGIIFNELEDYDKALEYHNQALEYLIKTDKRNALEPMTLNNIGVVYGDQKKYKEAITKYKEAQHKNNLYAKNIEREAIFIDNIAYTRFKLGDTTGVPQQFRKALKIRDSLNDMPGIVTNKLYLAEYYATYNDTAKALTYAREAHNRVVSSNYSGELLESLSTLSDLEKGEQGRNRLKTYIRLSDSLQKAERNLRDKFTRIQFETDQLELEKTQLIKDNARSRVWIVALSVSVLLAAGFTLYYYQRQRRYRKRFKALLERKDHETPKAEETQTTEDVPTSLNMSEAALLHITRKLNAFVEKKQFLRQDISLYSLAKAMDTNPKYLSKVINHYKGKSFITYIHELRIDHALEALKTDAMFRRYSISAIAEETGFNTADAFSRAFYRKTGIYPSYFIRELEKERSKQRKEAPSELRF